MQHRAAVCVALRADSHHTGPSLLLPLLLPLGKHIQGKVTTTISRGRLVWHDGKLDVAKGSGRLLQLSPFGPLFEGIDRQGASTAAQLLKSFSSRNGVTPVSRSDSSSSSSSGQRDGGREEL